MGFFEFVVIAGGHLSTGMPMLKIISKRNGTVTIKYLLLSILINNNEHPPALI